MAPDETPTGQVAAPEAPPSTETPTPPPPPKEGEGRGPIADLSQKITLPGGEQVTVGELVRAHGEAEELRQYRQQASVLMQGGDLPMDQREGAVRYVMTAEGYTPAQIEEYVSMMRETQETPTGHEEEGGSSPPRSRQPMEDPSSSQTSGGDSGEEWREVAERMRRMEERVNQADLDQMRLRLDGAVGVTLDEHEGLKILLGKANQLQDAEGAQKAKAVIQEELERQTLENLRVRKARGETFRMDWFAEESKRAADAVLAKFRSVIGDPDRLQRAPETESAEDRLLKREPVPTPEYKTGMSEGQVREQLHNWTVDTLSRLAAETDKGSGSRV